MRAFLKPVALCAVLVIGGLPGVVLACQWACDATTTVAASAGGHHHGGDHESVEAPASADGAAIGGVGHGCDHSPFLEVGVTTRTVLFVAPAAFVVPDVGASVTQASAHLSSAPAATFSPPGARSAPLPLRI